MTSPATIDPPLRDLTLWGELRFQCSKHAPYIKIALLTLIGIGAIFSAIGPLHIAGALIMRAVALIISCQTVAYPHQPHTQESLFLKILKIVTILLGITAIVVCSPFLMIVSLSIDVCYQVLKGVKALYNKEYRQAAWHWSIFLIDVIVIAGLVLGSWKLLAVAAIVNAVVMAAIACFNVTFVDIDTSASVGEIAYRITERFFYFILTVSSIGSIDILQPTAPCDLACVQHGGHSIALDDLH